MTLANITLDGAHITLEGERMTVERTCVRHITLDSDSERDQRMLAKDRQSDIVFGRWLVDTRWRD